MLGGQGSSILQEQPCTTSCRCSVSSIMAGKLRGGFAWLAIVAIIAALIYVTRRLYHAERMLKQLMAIRRYEDMSTPLPPRPPPDAIPPDLFDPGALGSSTPQSPPKSALTTDPATPPSPVPPCSPGSTCAKGECSVASPVGVVQPPAKASSPAVTPPRPQSRPHTPAASPRAAQVSRRASPILPAPQAAQLQLVDDSWHGESPRTEAAVMPRAGVRSPSPSDFLSILPVAPTYASPSPPRRRLPSPILPVRRTPSPVRGEEERSENEFVICMTDCDDAAQIAADAALFSTPNPSQVQRLSESPSSLARLFATPRLTV